MTVGQLRKLIEDLDDSTLVLRGAFDHSYVHLDLVKATALDDDGDWTEDHGEEITPEAEYGKRRVVLIPR